MYTIFVVVMNYNEWIFVGFEKEDTFLLNLDIFQKLFDGSSYWKIKINHKRAKRALKIIHHEYVLHENYSWFRFTKSVFYIRTLCLYAFRLCILNMHIISMSMRIHMMTVGAVLEVIGNVHCPSIAIVLKMCQFRLHRPAPIGSMSIIIGQWRRRLPFPFNPLRFQNKHRPHIVQALAIIGPHHTMNIMRMVS